MQLITHFSVCFAQCKAFAREVDRLHDIGWTSQCSQLQLWRRVCGSHDPTTQGDAKSKSLHWGCLLGMRYLAFLKSSEHFPNFEGVKFLMCCAGALSQWSGELSCHRSSLHGCYVWELCQCHTGRRHTTGKQNPWLPCKSTLWIIVRLTDLSLQVRSDWYVYVVLSSLPWVGKELYEKKDVEMDRLLNQIEGYLK